MSGLSDYADLVCAENIALLRRVEELEEALRWAMLRIDKKAWHQAEEGDGELYAFAAARAALSSMEAKS